MAIDTKDTGRMAGSMGKELRHKKTEIRFMPLGKKTCLMEMAMSWPKKEEKWKLHGIEDLWFLLAIKEKPATTKVGLI